MTWKGYDDFSRDLDITLVKDEMHALDIFMQIGMKLLSFALACQFSTSRFVFITLTTFLSHVVIFHDDIKAYKFEY